MNLIEWILIHIFGLIPILAGAANLWSTHNYGLAISLWGIYVVLSYIVWNIGRERYQNEKRRKQT